MTALHLGVLVQPYELYGRGKTTGDVAEILEGKYGIVQVFWRNHRQRIANALTKAMADSLPDMLGGTRLTAHIFDATMSQVAHQFKRYLNTGEVERSGIPGVPTQAALRGVSHRRAHPYRKRAPRRSFIDSGLYEASFEAWIDGWEQE